MSESLGALLAAHRRKYKHICEICGVEFEGIVTAKVCSGKCRSKRHYLNSKKLATEA